MHRQALWGTSAHLLAALFLPPCDASTAHAPLAVLEVLLRAACRGLSAVQPGPAENAAPMEALINVMGADNCQTRLSAGDQLLHLSRVSSHRRILIGLGAVPKLARLLVNLNPQQHSAAAGGFKRQDVGPADRTTELLLVALLTLVGGLSNASVSAVMSSDPDSPPNSNAHTCLDDDEDNDEGLLQNALADLAAQPGFPSRLVQLCQSAVSSAADPVPCCEVLSEGRRTFEFIVTHEGIGRPDMGLGSFGTGLAALKSDDIGSPVKSPRPCGLLKHAQLHAVHLVQALSQCAPGIDACLGAGV